MITFKQRNDHEQAALDRSLAARERQRRALQAVDAHWLRQDALGRWGGGDGQPPMEKLAELEAAQEEVRQSDAVCERIRDEIRTGKRL